MSTESDPGLEFGFPDPDPDVCRIAPIMLWIHCFVGIIHFAEFRKNRPVTV